MALSRVFIVNTKKGPSFGQVSSEKHHYKLAIQRNKSRS